MRLSRYSRYEHYELRDNHIHMMISKNGVCIPDSDLRIPHNDMSFASGYGVYETLRTYCHHVAFFDEHVERLFESAKIVGLKLDVDSGTLKKYVLRLLDLRIAEENSAAEFRVRITVSGGACPAMEVPSVAPDIYITAEVLTENTCDDITLKTIESVRILPRAKSTSMMASVYAHRRASEVNCYDALLVNNGYVTECAFANIFFLKGDTIITPENNILEGVTRAKILEVARSEKLQVEIRDVELQEIPHMTGAFLTKTSVGVLQVLQIDDVKFSPSPIVQSLKNSYDNLIKKMYEK